MTAQLATPPTTPAARWATGGMPVASAETVAADTVLIRQLHSALLVRLVAT
jgi:hypothetical protein